MLLDLCTKARVLLEQLLFLPGGRQLHSARQLELGSLW